MCFNAFDLAFGPYKSPYPAKVSVWLREKYGSVNHITGSSKAGRIREKGQSPAGDWP